MHAHTAHSEAVVSFFVAASELDLCKQSKPPLAVLNLAGYVVADFIQQYSVMLTCRQTFVPTPNLMAVAAVVPRGQKFASGAVESRLSTSLVRLHRQTQCYKLWIRSRERTPWVPLSLIDRC